jgi:lysophospholipase L1-like esterase
MRLFVRCTLFVLIALAGQFNATNRLLSQDTATLERFTIPATDEGLAGAGPIRRYDWFQNLWKTRRAQFAAQAAEQQGAIVFLGDSITQGWGDDFGGRFGDLKLANRGISGDTTRGMLVRLHEDVLSLNPAAVVMLMGTNDLEEQADPPTIVANIRLILNEIKAHDADVPIVLCQVMPSSESKNRPADKIREINRLLAAEVKGDPQITLLDSWTLFANAEGDAKVEEFPDLLHPNDAGYAKWKAALWPVFATLGFVETESDDFQPEPGFELLFNGKDLTGWGFRPMSSQAIESRGKWINRDPNNAPAWPIVTEPVSFDGKTSSDDGRYVAKHGRLIVTTPSEGRKIQTLSTHREFPDDFTLKLEFRATPNADSGVFLREPQLQCRDYPLAGPYKELKNYRAGDWNELVVVVKDGVAHCTCNGEVIEAALKLPATGPIGLEGDRGQMEYRRIRIAKN